MDKLIRDFKDALNQRTDISKSDKRRIFKNVKIFDSSEIPFWYNALRWFIFILYSPIELPLLFIGFLLSLKQPENSGRFILGGIIMQIAGIPYNYTLSLFDFIIQSIQYIQKP
jgi:hypothetical protein